MDGPEQNIRLGEAAAKFLATLSSQECEVAQQEINGFVRWYGWGRPIAHLSAPEVSHFAERIAQSTRDPQKKLEPVRVFLAYARKNGLTRTNLANNLRVKSSLSGPRMTGRQQPHQQVSFTREGYSELKSELDALISERPRIAAELKQAASDKDFRENAPLDAARERLGQLESRIRELESTLQSAAIINEKQLSIAKVGIGSTITLRELSSGMESYYTLVTPAETDPTKGKISSASPMGKAVLGHKEGETVEVSAPAGTLRYRIQRISTEEKR